MPVKPFKNNYRVMTRKQHTELHTNKDTKIQQLKSLNKELYEALKEVDEEYGDGYYYGEVNFPIEIVRKAIADYEEKQNGKQ
jgi:hypothetical protein